MMTISIPVDLSNPAHLIQIHDELVAILTMIEMAMENNSKQATNEPQISCNETSDMHNR